MLDYLSYLKLFIEEHPNFLLILGLLSVVCFIASLLLVPWIVVKLPSNYFSSGHNRGSSRLIEFPLLYWVSLLFKNILGVFLVLFGIILLLIPGQGLLTIFVGVLLINFPGKYHLERRLIQSKIILLSTSWLRAKYNKVPFIFDE
jgi:hypothetical protein